MEHLDDIGNVMCNVQQHITVLRLPPYILPQRPLICGVLRFLIGRRFRIPFPALEIIVIGQACKKVRIQAVTQLMGKKAADDLIAVLTPLILCHQLMPCIDPHKQVIGTGYFAGFRLPANRDMNTAIIFIASRLSHGHILKMSRKDAGREELPVRDLAALFIKQLLDLLVIHSCHKASASFLCFMPMSVRVSEQRADPEWL